MQIPDGSSSFESRWVEWKFDKSVEIIQGKLLMLSMLAELSELSVIKWKGWETTLLCQQLIEIFPR